MNFTLYFTSLIIELRNIYTVQTGDDPMGYYLNSKKPYLMFLEEYSSKYFIDKTKILEELIPIVDASATPFGKDPKYICITRPRRFGKTITANTISSYFSKGFDSQAAFQGLAVSSCKWFSKHLNKHNVIHIMCNEMPDHCTSYAQYISRIKKRLLYDLTRQFPDAPIEEEDALWDAFNSIIEFGTSEKFIFILDEWDFIFHKDFITDRDKMAYLDFLGSLLKDQPYVELAYLTGILPIAKYSSGSELNMFCEYTMASEQNMPPASDLRMQKQTSSIKNIWNR